MRPERALGRELSGQRNQLTATCALRCSQSYQLHKYDSQHAPRMLEEIVR